ncbi:hypothetical protein BDW02DRAFT_511801, partial [Decorospora gaudefroyi]
RILYYLIIEGVRLELRDLEASNNRKLFIHNNYLITLFSKKLRTYIIKDIYNSLSREYRGYTITY